MNSSFWGDALCWRGLHRLPQLLLYAPAQQQSQRCLEAKERTIYVGSVLQVVPLSCFCTSWPWYARIVLPWAEFPHGPCMPLGELCFALVCKWHRCSQKASWQPKHILRQTPSLPSQSRSPLQAVMKSMTKSSSQTKWIPPIWVISDDS